MSSKDINVDKILAIADEFENDNSDSVEDNKDEFEGDNNDINSINSDIDSISSNKKLSILERKESLKNGDYVIQVHIIEARNLKGRGWNDMSDPVVFAEVLNSKQSTEIKSNCSNVLFDQVLFFEFKNLDKNEINEGKCIISVYDANTIMRNVLIGLYEFDLATIYFNEYHEIYKQWIGLYDITDEHEGIQGYLKVSIVVLGPNDEQKTHKLVEEDQNETNLLSVLIPPIIEFTPYLLSISIYQCCDLTTKDIGFLSLSSNPEDKCDLYIYLEFAGCKLKTKKFKGINVSALTQLQIPVMEPIMSQSIKILFIDYNSTKRNETIGSLTFDYNQIKSTLLYDEAKWYPLYGAPVLSNQKSISNKMNKGHLEGTTYRGKILLSMKVNRETNRPKKGCVDISLPRNYREINSLFIIKCDLYEGSEIHKIHSLLNNQMYIQVSCGNYSAKSKKVDIKDGRCEWYQAISSTTYNNDGIGPISLPSDTTQCPDIFIYLVDASNNKHISYLRLSFQDIIEKKWKNPPKWYNLKEDKAINALDDDIFPGSILLAINGGTTDSIPPLGYLPESRPFAKRKQIISNDTHHDHDETSNINNNDNNSSNIGTLTVYIQQSQNLPAMDNNGKSDPYVQLKIKDINNNTLAAKTSVIKESLNPKWYQQFTFKNVSIGETLYIKIFDSDYIKKDDLIGEIDILLITQSDREPGTNFDVKNWFFINNDYPDAKLQCRLQFDFLSISELNKKKDSKFNTSSGLNILKKIAITSSPKCKHEVINRFGQPTKKSMQLRVHLYSARNLLSTDSSGLSDPYVIIRCCGQIAKSSIIYNNIDPEWNETLILNVLLPLPLTLAPDIHIQLFDYDKFSSDDNLGRLIIKPNNIFINNNNINGINNNDTTNKNQNNNLNWYKLYDEELKEIVAGEILMSFQLFGVSHNVLPVVPSLKPQTEEKWLQIVILGLRSLNSIFKINKSYIKFNINNKIFKTKKSNKPNSNNPNFLQILKIKLQFPIDHIFAPSLRFTVKDSLFGGVINRTIGNASISLQQLLLQKANETKNEIETEAEMKKSKDSQKIIQRSDDIVIDISSNDSKDNKKEQEQQEEEKEEKIAEDLKDIISNANSAEILSNFKSEESFDLSAEQNVDMSDDLPEYMIGRKIIDNELEDEILMKPFIEIPIHSGQINSKINKYRRIGYFKGLIELTNTKNSSEFKLKNNINISELLQPKNLYLRLYILRGIRLTPKDNDGTCDPYLVIKLGKKKMISTRSKYIKNTLNPEFYESFEFVCSIPGSSKLEISVWDYDGIGDDLVGKTQIDIEDRWFSSSWRKLKNENKNCGKIPLEIRTLRSLSSSFAQGKLELWLEILTDREVKQSAIINIKPPPPTPHELRVIIWECKDITIKDTVTQMNDLYVTGYLDLRGLKEQKTDLHFRSQKGFGSFNWRFKYNINLPLKKPPRFRIQIWDKDYFSINDSICEAYLSLTGLFKLCIKKRDRVIMKFKGKEKFWINELKHSNFEGNQGKIKISIECMPMDIAQQLPAGFGRSDPNMNPFLPEPHGRAKFSIFSPLKSLRNLLGDKMYWKLIIGFLMTTITSFLVLIGPTLVSAIMAKAFT